MIEKPPLEWRRPFLFWRGLSGCDSLGQVVLFFLGFCAYGEGVEDSGVQGEADGFGWAIAESALSEDLHPNDAFAVGAHLLDDLDDGGGVGVHVGASGIEAD